MARYALQITLAAGLAALATGCGEAPPPQFRLNMVQAATNDIGDDYQREIANVLEAIFGTPDNPQVLPETGLNQTALNLAAGPSWTSPDDLTHGLYRQHCVHCHGVTGDGRGPTARFLDPYPRDYRKGVFKFKSTYPDAKPTNDDLVRILHNGIPGTSMPSFSLLPKPEVEALVEYVKYLAMRGQMETALVNYVFNDLGEVEAENENGEPVMNEDGTPVMERMPLDPQADPEQADIIKEELATIVESWQTADEYVIVPEADMAPADDRSEDEVEASIVAGRELFYGKDANCFSCHGPTALGDGQQNDYDDWTKDVVALVNLIDSTEKTIESLQTAPEDETDDQAESREQRIEEEEARLATLRQVADEQFAVRNAIPRNLRQGIYRGGRRRLDVFDRIHAGIKGVPMPGSGPTAAGGTGPLNEEQIWQIVDYVMSLPYEPSSGPAVDLPDNQAAVTR
jgi:mono/diheme cytochrome c family protein